MPILKNIKKSHLMTIGLIFLSFIYYVFYVFIFQLPFVDRFFGLQDFDPSKCSVYYLSPIDSICSIYYALPISFLYNISVDLTDIGTFKVLLLLIIAVLSCFCIKNTKKVWVVILLGLNVLLAVAALRLNLDFDSYNTRPYTHPQAITSRTPNYLSQILAVVRK